MGAQGGYTVQLNLGIIKNHPLKITSEEGGDIEAIVTDYNSATGVVS